MDADSKFAFIDESGNFDQKAGRMLVISAVVSDNRIQLARAMKNAEKKNRSIAKKNCGEMKAAAQLPNTRKKVLSHLLKSEFSVFSLIFDLMTIDNTPYKFDEIYSVGMSMLCSRIFSLNFGIHFVLDKRYTKESLRNALSHRIRELIYKTNHVNPNEIDVIHGDSIEYAELRAADYVAYETYQKYKFGSNIYDIFTDRTETIMYYGNLPWGEIIKESRTPLK